MGAGERRFSFSVIGRRLSRCPSASCAVRRRPFVVVDSGKSPFMRVPGRYDEPPDGVTTNLRSPLGSRFQAVCSALGSEDRLKAESRRRTGVMARRAVGLERGRLFFRRNS